MSNIKIKTCKALYGIDDKKRYSIDNYSDFVEDKNKKFYIDVRFHPESLYKIDAILQNNVKNIRIYNESTT